MGLNQSRKKSKGLHTRFSIEEERKIFPKAITIGLLGDEKVGKTSISNSFFNLNFCEEYHSTIGIDKSEKKQLLKNGKEIKLRVEDTGGQERFRTFSLNALKSAQGIVLVFDVTNRKSFENLEEWLRKIKENFSNPSIILFGNKVDVDKDKWAVRKEEIYEFMQKINLKYFDISAKNGINIKEGFSHLLDEITDKIEKLNLQEKIIGKDVIY